MPHAPFSLQEKMSQLEALEAYFQRPDMNLEEAIEKHKQALGLAKEILEYLEKAETTIQKIDMQSIITAVSTPDEPEL